jgi:hypothetical protein
MDISLSESECSWISVALTSYIDDTAKAAKRGKYYNDRLKESLSILQVVLYTKICPEALVGELTLHNGKVLFPAKPT